ncbi:MAG: helix-turn-helix domain-containing protein, partial [Desulfonatronovibrionaceae bacterium]
WDTRIVASSSCDLAREVHEKRFLEELYFRLNVFPVKVPSIRERAEDVPLLLNAFVKAAGGPGKRRMVFTPKCLDLLVHYSWPGNLREMEALVHRLYLTVPGRQVDVRHLPEKFSAAAGNKPKSSSQSSITLEELEKQEVLCALDRNGWVQARAARELGISQRQMGYRVAKFGLRQEVNKFRQLVHR